MKKMFYRRITALFCVMIFCGQFSAAAAEEETAFPEIEAAYGGTALPEQEISTVSDGERMVLFDADTVTEGDFTAQIANGEATLTAWNAVDSYWDRQDVRIPNRIGGYPVVKIADSVFRGRYLSSLILPEGLQEIGGNAFTSSYLSGAVQIPASVQKIGTYAFSYMRGVTSFEVAPSNPSYCSEDGVLYNKDKSTLINYPLDKPDTAFTVPETVSLLYCTSFADVKSLENLYVPSDNIRAMGYTFYRDNFVVWCEPDTTLYEQLAEKKFDTSVTVKEFVHQEVAASGQAIQVTFYDPFIDGVYLLAAYSPEGQMLAVRSVGGSGSRTYHLPGTNTVSEVRLFRLNPRFAPAAAAEVIWKK